jgi:hypothetical protein
MDGHPAAAREVLWVDVRGERDSSGSPPVQTTAFIRPTHPAHNVRHEQSSFTRFFGASHAGVFIDAACAFARRAIERMRCESPCFDASQLELWTKCLHL